MLGCSGLINIANLIELISGSSVAIEVAPEQLVRTSSSIKTKLTSVQSTLKDMEDTMKVISRYWEGSKHSLRLSDFNQSVNQMEMLMTLINTYSNKLQRIGENYINTENINEDSAGELPVSVIS